LSQLLGLGDRGRSSLQAISVIDNPYKPPNVPAVESPSLVRQNRIVDWQRTRVAVFVDCGTAIAIWTYGMIDRFLHGMRYVPYSIETEYTIIVWTIVESIPVLIATTYVAHYAKRSLLGTFAVYILGRSLVVAGLSWEILPYLELNHYLMYVGYITLIVFLGFGVSLLIQLFDRRTTRTNNPMDRSGGSAAT
jgi:hypothetical protein